MTDIKKSFILYSDGLPQTATYRDDPACTRPSNRRMRAALTFEAHKEWEQLQTAHRDQAKIG